jgi:hypothetical protein
VFEEKKFNLVNSPVHPPLGDIKVLSEFNTNFPVLDKRDFKSMRDVRKYAPNQTVNWSRCAHGEFRVMQVYQGWDNSGRRF